MDDIVTQAMLRMVNEPPQDNLYRAELEEETHVLPSLCGLPRIIRAFVPH
jgi:hypothetical protein